jgi:hypothetical protein
VATDDLLGAVALDALGALVPGDDVAGRVQEGDGVLRDAAHQLQHIAADGVVDLRTCAHDDFLGIARAP